MVGCGGGGTDNTTDTQNAQFTFFKKFNPSDMDIVGIEYPLNNIRVFADYNGDGKLSPNEPSIDTSADGKS